MGYVFMSGFPRLHGIVSFPDYTRYGLGARLTVAHVEGSEQQILLRVLIMTDLTGVDCPSQSFLV